jgi:hypothetical protein
LKGLVKGLIVLAIGAAVGCGGGGTGILLNPFNPANLIGTWNGQWNNNTFSTTGAARMIGSSGGGNSVVMNLDLDGPVFGGGDPAAEDITGTATSNTLAVNEHTTLFGDFVLDIDSQGHITGQGLHIVSPDVSAISLNGTAIQGKMTINYSETLVAGGHAQGVLVLNKS